MGVFSRFTQALRGTPVRKLTHPITAEQHASLAEADWADLTANERAVLRSYWYAAIASLSHYYEVSQENATVAMLLASHLADPEADALMGDEVQALQHEIAAMDDRQRELWLATWVRTCEPMLRMFPDLVEPTAELTGYHWLTDHDVERRIFKKFRPMRIPATT